MINNLPFSRIEIPQQMCLKQSPVPCTTMHDWFCQIELIESIWQKKAEVRESSIECVLEVFLHNFCATHWMYVWRLSDSPANCNYINLHLVNPI